MKASPAGPGHEDETPEHVVDLETGAILAAPVHQADVGDAGSIEASLEAARTNVLAAVEEVEKDVIRSDDDDPPPTPGGADDAATPGEASPVDVVGDKGYHKAQLLVSLEERGFRPYIPERKQAGRRRWTDKGGKRTARAFHNNRARVKRAKNKAYHRLRGELVERTFAHVCETGGHRRTRLRGLGNMSKRYVIQAAAMNLGLVLRRQLGWGTPRGLADAAVAVFFILWRVLADAAAVVLYRRRLCVAARSTEPQGTGHRSSRLGPLRNAASSTGC